MKRPWCCPFCRLPLGTIQRDGTASRRHRRLMQKLVLTDRAESVQQRTTCYVVHCPCGGYREWRGGRIEGPDKG